MQANNLLMRRRMPGSARLGWTQARSVVVPLGAIKQHGGVVPRTLARVQRRLPMVYWERTSDGGNVRRTPRARAAAERRLGAGLHKARPVCLQPPHMDLLDYCIMGLAAGCLCHAFLPPSYTSVRSKSVW